MNERIVNSYDALRIATGFKLVNDGAASPNGAQRRGYRVYVLMRFVLVKSKRLDSRFVNCSGHRQAVIALEVRQSRSRVNAQRTGNFSVIIPCILQGGLDIGDYFIREQITVSVDGPVIVVIALQRIIAPRWIPVASVEKIVSRSNEHDGVTMTVPPVSIVPLGPVTAECLVKADLILLVVRLLRLRVFQRFVHFRLTCRRGIRSNMLLRIDRRECSILSRKSRAFMHRGYRAQFGFTGRWIQADRLSNSQGTMFAHRRQRAQFSLPYRRIKRNRALVADSRAAIYAD